jgi:phosphoribosylformylglycinamidine synthase
MYSACEAMRDVLLQLGVGVDGGKDSLSMAAKVGDEMVKAPGQLVLTAYAPVPDVRRVFTPDLKREADIYADDSGKDSVLILVVFVG